MTRAGREGGGGLREPRLLQELCSVLQEDEDRGVEADAHHVEQPHLPVRRFCIFSSLSPHA
jgi:hypothetical protein